MGDVISGFGVAASFLQAVHNLLESSKVVSSFVHRVKDAHNKLQRLGSELSLVQALLESLSQFLEINIKNDIIPAESEPRFWVALQEYQDDLASMLKGIEIFEVSNTSAMSLNCRVRFALKNGDLSRSMDNLNASKQNIFELLQLINLYYDFMNISLAVHG
jgi:hypothetical protein